MSAKLTLRFKPKRGNAFRESHQVNENSELFKKPKTGALFQWEQTSSTIQSCHSLWGSETEATTSSRCSSFRVYESHWTKEGYEEHYGIRGQTVFCLSTYLNFRPLGLTGGEEKSYLPFVSTLRSPTRIGPSMPVFQRVSGSPDRAYPDPNCLYVECRSVYGPLAFDLPRVIRWGIAVAPADDP